MSASSVALNTVETGLGPLRAVRRRGPTSPFGDCLKIEPKPGGQSLIRLQAFLNFASKRGVGAGAGVKLAGHDPLFLRLLINRALTKSPTHGGVRANSRAVPVVLASAHEQSVPIFQQLAGGHPSGRDDVRQISVVASKRQRGRTVNPLAKPS